jgi:nucleoside-diphosphate-sugar epimerase
MTDFTQLFDKVFDNDPLLKKLSNSSIFMTGGTGFIGSTFLEMFVWANDKHNLNINVTTLTRDPIKFKAKAPHLFNYPNFKFIKGDITSFEPDNYNYSLFIHAATDANPQTLQNFPMQSFNTIVNGTKNLLDFATKCSASKFLLLSSGAVYGQHSQAITETTPSTIDLSKITSIYSEGKRMAEWLCSLYSHNNKSLNIAIARCFAFIGPYLPLNREFAAGNFISNVINNKDIIIKSDGSAVRSYLSSIDLIRYLLHILLLSDNHGIYNVGSDHPITILELAQMIHKISNTNSKIQVMNENISSARNFYIPSTLKLQNTFGINSKLDLEYFINFTLNWYRQKV